ncbi:MAG: anthranilate synthase component I [Candidatus Bathyarchaeia archaeon]
MAIFSSLYEKSEYSFLLESLDGIGGSAKYTFLGCEPRWIFKAKGIEVFVEDRQNEETIEEKFHDPLQVLRGLLRAGAMGDPPIRFAGGAVGYLSYDSIRYWERLPRKATGDLEFPDIEMAIYDDFIMFDRYRGQAFYCSAGEDRFDEFMELAKGHRDPGDLHYSEPRSNIPYSEFGEIVAKAKEYIASGDIFQVVLSRRFEFMMRGDRLRFYRELRRINPSPYMYFLKMGEREVIGSSPETFVRIENGAIETFPIAGTRPRSNDPEEDRRLAIELLEDPKERAEHVMLVDLARNDLGKVSRFGSVRVSEFMSVYKYSHVQHIVSKVIGELESDKDCYDAIRALFPAGTVSGAPKVRAMEIIDELEPSKRGPYAGAVGYFSYNGNADFAITIRTLVANLDRGYIQTGAGIVADSDPEREWLETEHKASALFKALQLSEA